MKFYINFNSHDAIYYGFNRPGKREFDLDVTKLSEKQRIILSDLASTVLEEPIELYMKIFPNQDGFIDVKDIIANLDERIAKNEQYEEEKKQWYEQAEKLRKEKKKHWFKSFFN